MHNLLNYDYLLGGMTAGIFLFLFIFLGFFLVYYIIYIIGLWNLFKKAGKPGWAALIPYYKNWVLVEASGLNWWWFLIILSSVIMTFLKLNIFGLLASLAPLLGKFNCNYNLAKKFGKETGFAIGMTLLPGIFIPIIGFGKSISYNDVDVSSNGIFNEDRSDSYQFCSNCGSKIINGAKYCSKCGKEVH